MAKAPDWTDIADKLNREREKLQDKLPEGVVCWLDLDCHGYGLPMYRVTIIHRTIQVSGNGEGRTPAKATAAAVKEFSEKMREHERKPRLASAEVKALPPATPARGLFD